MTVINIYEYAGDTGMTSAMIFRYLIISEVWGMELPKDTKIKNCPMKQLERLKQNRTVK